MDLTAADIEKIPAENLHVSRAEFAAVWIAVEKDQDELARRGVTDWYGAGVSVTCRWLATATVRPERGAARRPARSPVTRRISRALPELIQEECLAAELLVMRGPVPRWLAERPGWAESIVATLNWAWWRTGLPPVRVQQAESS
jgi:hypothetical protein